MLRETDRALWMVLPSTGMIGGDKSVWYGMIAIFDVVPLVLRREEVEAPGLSSGSQMWRVSIWGLCAQSGLPLGEKVLLDRPEVRVLAEPFPLLNVLGPKRVFDVSVRDVDKLLAAYRC